MGHDSRDDGVLVRKDPKHGAFGDTGGFGNLPGGDVGSVAGDERQGRQHNGGPALIGRQRGRPARGQGSGRSGHGQEP